LSDFNELGYSQQPFENTPMQHFMKMHPMVAELFHTDGQTDMTKLTVTARNFENAPQNIQTQAQKSAQVA
jgi:hypothetical protein